MLHICVQYCIDVVAVFEINSIQFNVQVSALDPEEYMRCRHTALNELPTFVFEDAAVFGYAAHPEVIMSLCFAHMCHAVKNNFIYLHIVDIQRCVVFY